MVLSMGHLDWESSALTTRPSLHKELTSKIDFEILVCKMHADDEKDGNTRNGSRKLLTSSLMLHMKGLNILEVSKSCKPQNVWDNRYQVTKRD